MEAGFHTAENGMVAKVGLGNQASQSPSASRRGDQLRINAEAA